MDERKPIESLFIIVQVRHCCVWTSMTLKMKNVLDVIHTTKVTLDTKIARFIPPIFTVSSCLNKILFPSPPRCCV